MFSAYPNTRDRAINVTTHSPQPVLLPAPPPSFPTPPISFEQYSSPVTTSTQYSSPVTTPTQYSSPVTTPTQYSSLVTTPTRYSTHVTTPTVTDNILVLYCKDEFLTADFNPSNRRSSAQYCQEVSDFVEILTSLSNKYDDHGRVYQAYSFSYDRLAVDGNYIHNLLSWSDDAIIRCNIVILLCSPQLGAIMNSTVGGIIEMEYGKFHKDSLTTVLTQKPVIPVFLNMEIYHNWMPLPLQHALCYSVNIKTLQGGCDGINNIPQWRERVESLFSVDRRLDGFVDLWKVLLKDTPQRDVPLPPLLPPSDNIDRHQLMELAEDVKYIWQNLATRLGVPNNIQQTIQHKNVDCTQKTIMMFDEWIRYKRDKANKISLTEGLRSCKYNAIADRVERSFT